MSTSGAVLEQCWTAYLADLQKIDGLKPAHVLTLRSAFLVGASAALAAALEIEIRMDLEQGEQAPSATRSIQLRELAVFISNRLREVGTEIKQ